jgi:lysophospholipase L1-like esterase
MLACPTALTLSSASGQPVAAAYGTATITGGAPPVSTTCTPAAGSTFPVGATTVTCTATDALRRTQSCNFIVTVVLVPRLSLTNVLAFGDSITAGEINAADTLLVEPSEAYPADLQALLGQRYAPQPIIVFNDGKSGETAVKGAERLPGELALHHPDLLLLIEGINDLHGSVAGGGIPTALSALRTMIQQARSAGVRVIVGTLLPATPGALLPGTIALIDPFNAQLIPMALANGALVVDLHSAFVAGMSGWLGSDGIHPGGAGQGRALGRSVLCILDRHARLDRLGRASSDRRGLPGNGAALLRHHQDELRDTAHHVACSERPCHAVHAIDEPGSLFTARTAFRGPVTERQFEPSSIEIS